MAYEINIKGEVIPYSGYGDQYICCDQVEAQMSLAKGDDLIVNINSIGGDVEEGFMIYTALRKYAVANKAKITTYAKGRCYSIATVIFLAGDERIANKFLSPFIHNAWMYSIGDSKQLMKDAIDLDVVNKRISVFYSEHTDLTVEEATQLMDADTFLSPEESVKIRFATSIEEVVRPLALARLLGNDTKTISNNKSNMKKPSKNTVFNKLMNLLNAQASVELYTSTNELLDFTELEDGEEIKVGDKATLNDKPAEGEILLQDGRTLVFEAGVLTEIKEKEGDESVTIEELQAENAKLKEQINAQNKKFTEFEETVNESLKASNKKISEMEKTWQNLKDIASEYSDDDDDDKGNAGKTRKEGGDNPKGLGASIKAMKDKQVK